MTEYYNKPTYIEKFTSDKLLPGHEKVHLCFVQKNRSKGIVLDFKDVFFLPSSLSNLVSLTLLNNSRI